MPGRDLVCERHALFAHAAMETAHILGLPSVLEVNAPLIKEQARHRTLVLPERAGNSARRAVESVAAVTREVARYAIGLGAPRVAVIPNAVDPARFPAHREPGGPFTLGFLGTLKPWHDVATLIDALALLRAGPLPEARLLIVGDGPERPALEARLAALGLADAATFTGALPSAGVPGAPARMRADLFRHLQALPLSFPARARTGDLTLRLISDVAMLKETAVTAAMPLLASLLVLAGMIGVMLALDWRLTLLALTSMRLTRRIREASRASRKREGELAATASEAMAGIRSVQALGLEERLACRFARTNAGDLKAGVRGKRLGAALERSVYLLTGIGLAVVLWFGTLQVLKGRLSPGDLLVFITYLKNTFRPVREYAKYTGRLVKASAAGERIVTLLDEEATIRDAPDAHPAPRFKGDIAFEDVRLGCAGGDAVLDGLALAIPAGTRAAVTGPSGGGKSTLLSLLLRLHDPQAGRITIDGQNICDFTLRSLRQRIGYVPQETLILHGSLAENIALGAERDVTRARIEAAARLARAHDFAA